MLMVGLSLVAYRGLDYHLLHADGWIITCCMLSVEYHLFHVPSLKDQWALS